MNIHDAPVLYGNTKDNALAEAEHLLNQDLPPDRRHCSVLMWRIEKARLWLAQDSSAATQALYERRMQALHPKDATVTDLDRTTIMQAGSAEAEGLLKRLLLTYELCTARIDLLREYAHDLGKEGLQDGSS